MFEILFEYQADETMYVVTLKAARIDGEPDLKFHVFQHGTGSEFETRRQAFTAARRTAEGAASMARHAKLLCGDNLGSFMKEFNEVLNEEREMAQ